MYSKADPCTRCYFVHSLILLLLWIPPRQSLSWSLRTGASFWTHSSRSCHERKPQRTFWKRVCVWSLPSASTVAQNVTKLMRCASKKRTFIYILNVFISVLSTYCTYCHFIKVSNCLLLRSFNISLLFLFNCVSVCSHFYMFYMLNNH